MTRNVQDENLDFSARDVRWEMEQHFGVKLKCRKSFIMKVSMCGVFTF